MGVEAGFRLPCFRNDSVYCCVNYTNRSKKI